jgi:hypothetical protein
VDRKYTKDGDYLVVLDGVEIHASTPHHSTPDALSWNASTVCVPLSSITRADVQLTIVAPLPVRGASDSNFCHSMWRLLLPFANDMHLLRRQGLQDVNLVLVDNSGETSLEEAIESNPAGRFLHSMFRQVYCGWQSFFNDSGNQAAGAQQTGKPPAVHQLAIHPYRLSNVEMMLTTVPRMFGVSKFTFSALPFTSIAAKAFGTNLASGVGLQDVVPGPALRGLFMTRCGPKVTGRRLLNGMAVRALFEDRGFELQHFQPGALSVRETVGLLRQAKYLIGAHGAGLANLAFMNQGTAVLEIFPANFMDGMYRSLAGWNGMYYLFYQASVAESVTCHEADHQGHGCKEFYKNSDMLVDLSRLNATVIGLERLLIGQHFNYELPTIMDSGAECTNSTVKWCDSTQRDPRMACHIFGDKATAIIPTSPLCVATEVLTCPQSEEELALYADATIEEATRQKAATPVPKVNEKCDRYGNITCLSQEAGCMSGNKRSVKTSQRNWLGNWLNDDDAFDTAHRFFP